MNEKKNEYWNHFVIKRNYHPKSFTDKRLETVKKIIWDDKDFWNDVFFRHNGISVSPQEMKDNDFLAYEHCICNMVGMVHETLIKIGAIK